GATFPGRRRPPRGARAARPRRGTARVSVPSPREHRADPWLLRAGGEDCIAGLERVEDFDSGAELPGTGVTPVQMGLGRMAEEELAATGLRAAGGNAESAVEERKRTVLVGERPAGPTVAVASRVSALDDEVRNDPVECQSVVETAIGERRQRRGRERRDVGAEIDHHLSAARQEAQHAGLWHRPGVGWYRNRDARTAQRCRERSCPRARTPSVGGAVRGVDELLADAIARLRHGASRGWVAERRRVWR